MSEREREREMATRYRVISKIFTLNNVEHHHDETSGKKTKFNSYYGNLKMTV